MTRQLPKAPSLERHVGRIQPKVELVIVCEGRNTEPQYFTDCVAYYGAGMVRLTLIEGAGVPVTLVDCAVNERNKLIEKRNASKDSFDACFRVWAVFDRDEHPNVPDALSKARENNIDIAFSNPCFELWPLLHLCSHGAQDGRAIVQRRLSDLMPKYDHGAGAFIDFDLIKNKFQIAFDRANMHIKSREEEDCPLGSPSTTVGSLILKIIQNGKCGLK